MTNFRYIKNLIWCVMTPTHNFVTRSKKHSYIQGSYMYYIRIRAAKKQTALISNYRRSVRFMTCRIPWWGAWQNVSCFVLMSRRSASLRSHRVFSGDTTISRYMSARMNSQFSHLTSPSRTSRRASTDGKPYG